MNSDNQTEAEKGLDHRRPGVLTNFEDYYLCDVNFHTLLAWTLVYVQNVSS